MPDKLQTEGEQRMHKSLDALRQALARIRTGRANPTLVEDVRVSCYGSEMPLKQVANVVVEGGRTLAISPWDPKLIRDIEKSLLKSDIGITPTLTGDVIRMSMPPLTEENRKKLVKVARQESEQARVAVRNIRRDLNGTFKNMTKDGTISEDEERRAQTSVQKMTDLYISKIGSMLERKEADLLDIG